MYDELKELILYILQDSRYDDSIYTTTDRIIKAIKQKLDESKS